MARKKVAAAAMPGPGLAADPIEPEDLDVNTRAYDTRPITPDEIKTHKELTGLADVAAELIADQVAERLVEFLGGREPWRQEYTSRQAGWGDTEMVLPRFPIELPVADVDGFQVPEVTLRSGDLSTSETISAEDYTIRGRCRRQLYRLKGWPWTVRVSDTVREDPLPGMELSDFTIGNAAGLGAAGSLTAGYLMPGQLGSLPDGPRKGTPTAALDTWQPSTAYDVGQSTAYGDAVGSFVKPNDRTLGFVLECTVAGTSGAGPADPTWNTTIGGTTVEAGGPTWTTRGAHVLPRVVRDALWKMAKLIYNEGQGTACAAGDWMKIWRTISEACI